MASFSGGLRWVDEKFRGLRTEKQKLKEETERLKASFMSKDVQLNMIDDIVDCPADKLCELAAELESKQM